MALAPSRDLFGGAVEGDHRLVDLDLILGVQAGDGVENVAVDGLDRLQDALAAVAALVAVAQFHRLVRPGRGARGHRRAAHGAVLEDDIDLDRRIAAAVEDFAGDDVDDGGHDDSSADDEVRGGFYARCGGGRKTREDLLFSSPFDFNSVFACISI